jgi:hypothetical protein
MNTMNTMICPSCRTKIRNVNDEICSECGAKIIRDTEMVPVPSFVRPAVRPKIQCEVDIATSVDRTGSSKEFETGIPLTFETIVRQVAAKAREVRCWLGSHGDLDLDEQFVLHTDGGTVDQAVFDIRTISYGGGGDPPEHHLDAVETLLERVPWNGNLSKARGAILLFATADTKPAQSGNSAQAIGKKIRDRGILLYLVCQPTPTLNELAEAAGGMTFEISNNPDSKSLQKIAAALSASIVASVTTRATTPMQR